MRDATSNDNDFPARAPDGPDAHGHAAILLVECLIHELIDRKVLGVDSALGLVGSATEVAEEYAESPPGLTTSVGVLNAIQASLAHDSPLESGR